MNDTEIKIMIEALELYVRKQKSDIVLLFQVDYQKNTTIAKRKKIDAIISEKSACYRKANAMIKEIKEQRHNNANAEKN